MVIMDAGRGSRLSRVTLVGRRRRVDLVLPSDEPVGRFLPDVLELLDDRPEDPPVSRHLVTAAGTVLPQDGSLASAGVSDGAVLRVVRAQYAPAAPVVHDVTDEVAEDAALRAWTWSPSARRWTAAALSVLLALMAAVLAWRSAGPATVGPWSAAVAAAAVIAGAAATRLGHRGAGNRGLGAALLAIGGVLGLLAVAALAAAHGWPVAAGGAGAVAVAVLALALLGALTPVGRGGLMGAGALLAAGVAWEAVTLAVGGDMAVFREARVGAVVAVVSLVALGLLPRFALLTAGLTSLDDRRAGGVTVGRYQVETALAAAHRGLAMATVVTAGSAAAAGWLAAGTPGWWSAALCLVVAVVLSSRARAFPLTVEAIALHLAAAVVLVRLVAVWLGGRSGTVWPVLLLCGVVLALLAVLALQPPDHVRVRLRRAADLAEAVGVVVLFPLLIGVFGLYARLLGAF
ncbi:type VII secretion integral membrane protein EccD [Streptomyces sp. SL13]|uniref:Type VII secretion integral membrane protein EccD n=1 Tax=Streptantibioticus silvisoli TaxID=2705255 RepID=A0AA90KGB0_9ACTN|nr:type VII secretion integral membrane protein EccD [Streptantibioticus silvisoli]MDI5969944.1 type VII secretion integral membrane protein EccD [Streptantibioticus silvisoli]